MTLRYWRARLRIAGWVNHFGSGVGWQRRLAARIHAGYSMTYTDRGEPT